MSKRLKLTGLSARTLRSGKTLVNADSSEKTSPYFVGEEKRTSTKKHIPIKIKHEMVENETNVKETLIKSEDVELSTDVKDIKTEECEIKNENVEPKLDPKNVKDEKQWMPPNWETILENIKEMRKSETAPVDTMGCHKCTDPDASPVVSRYQSLVALMLSSQTKDQVTHAAMQRLNTYGCKPNIIAATPDDVLGKLIYPVGFWKVKINTYLFTRYFSYLKLLVTFIKSIYYPFTRFIFFLVIFNFCLYVELLSYL